MKVKTIRIRSKNAVFQHAQALKTNRVKRTKCHEFIVEGVRNLNQAIAKGWRIKALYYDQERKLSDWAKHILDTVPVETHYVLDSALQSELSDKEETSELLALIAIPDDDVHQVPLEEDLLLVVCDRPASPGNLGTLIRSCDALGVHGIIITGHAVDIYDPAVIRASMGSFFSLPLVRLPSHKECFAWIDALRPKLPTLQIVGTSVESSKLLHEFNFAHNPTILIFGNERYGLSQNYKQLVDALVTIPMGGSADSLNISCAASIVLYEIARQRRLPKLENL